MRMTWRKLVADTRALARQTVALNLLIGLGVMLFVGLYAAHQNLTRTYDHIYTTGRLADASVLFESGPESLVYRARTIPHVTAAMGRVVRPHVYRPLGFEPLGPPLGRPENLAIVREGMRRVVGPSGTARMTPGLATLRVAAKTGTAQLTDDADLPINEAWFVGYAPAESPRFAFAVLLHRTDKEGADAAPIALRALEICGELFGRWW